MCRIASLFTLYEFIRLFFLGYCKNEVISRQSWRVIQFRRRIKNETDLKPLRKAIKQFVLGLRAVEEKQRYCIKMIFGRLNNL